MQPFRRVLGKDVPKICSKFTVEHPCRSVISMKLEVNFCTPVALLHIFRAPCPKNTSGGLPLTIYIIHYPLSTHPHTHTYMYIYIYGGTTIFQGRGGFLEKRDFDKHSTNKTWKKVPLEKMSNFILLDTVKTTC